MAEQLTIQQQNAVNDRGGDLLVSAAAGSGKTKVLVERLMKYITDPVNPVNIDDFLIITFTKAAAAELRGKISKALTQRIAEDPGNIRLQQQFQRLYLAKISTVHAFCADILREYAYMLELPGDFRMIEELEDTPLRYHVLDKVLSEAYDSVGVDKDFTAFVDTQGVGRNDQQVPDLILKVYDSAMCHMDSERWLQKCLDDADVSDMTDAAQTLWGKYLMEELFEAADQHCQALEKAASICDSAEGLEKMAQILWNMAKKPETESASAFADVKSDDWYFKQIVWAYENGYINGVSDSEFNPNGNITREQAMTILYRSAGSPETAETLEKFEDRENISSFALSAMSWAVENKIISGVSNTEIAPKQSATRAQLATIIVRFIKTFHSSK